MVAFRGNYFVDIGLVLPIKVLIQTIIIITVIIITELKFRNIVA
jgi:hypothetical protein